MLSPTFTTIAYWGLVLNIGILGKCKQSTAEGNNYLTRFLIRNGGDRRQGTSPLKESTVNPEIYIQQNIPRGIFWTRGHEEHSQMKEN